MRLKKECGDPFGMIVKLRKTPSTARRASRQWHGMLRKRFLASGVEQYSKADTFCVSFDLKV